LPGPSSDRHIGEKREEVNGNNAPISPSDVRTSEITKGRSNNRAKKVSRGSPGAEFIELKPGCEKKKFPVHVPLTLWNIVLETSLMQYWSMLEYFQNFSVGGCGA
jgi:hypothetical protein